MKEKVVLDFLAETGKLKQVKRSGWWMVGAYPIESVADHSFRCAVVGYMLAKEEGADTGKVVLMSLFGDLPEARINDLHKVANRYLNTREAERAAYKDQLSGLDAPVKNELSALRAEYDAQKTREAIVARDADLLECVIQAKEYSDSGFKKAEKFFKKGPKLLKTKSAKKIWSKLLSWDSTEWWENVSKFER
jgi:putative hydrolase of HD superfamily